jgi:Lrp/AsnC family transcriptional regulator, regulator for asnA, asnC and gidA
MLDSLNCKIIESLSINARTPLLQLANNLNISESAVRKRVKNLEEKGVIKQYSLVVDNHQLGYNNIALVGVDARPDLYLEVASKLKSMDEIKFVASTIGDHMFMLEIVAKDNDELTMICDLIRSIDGVSRICPAVVKDTLKGNL